MNNTLMEVVDYMVEAQENYDVIRACALPKGEDIKALKEAYDKLQDAKREIDLILYETAINNI